MILLLRNMAWLCFTLLAMGLFAGFAGVVHPVGDSLAVFRLQFGISSAVFGVLLLVLGARFGGWLVLGAIAAVVRFTYRSHSHFG